MKNMKKSLLNSPLLRHCLSLSCLPLVLTAFSGQRDWYLQVVQVARVYECAHSTMRPTEMTGEGRNGLAGVAGVTGVAGVAGVQNCGWHPECCIQPAICLLKEFEMWCEVLCAQTGGSSVLFFAFVFLFFVAQYVSGGVCKWLCRLISCLVIIYMSCDNLYHAL